MADIKCRNPLKMTTTQNLNKTNQNARMKIINQIKYSKRYPIAFSGSSSPKIDLNFFEKHVVSKAYRDPAIKAIDP